MRQRPARDGRVLDGSARLRLSGAGQATRIRVIAEGAGKKHKMRNFYVPLAYSRYQRGPARLFGKITGAIYAATSRIRRYGR